ncbi:MAG: hypothetical protein RJB01_1128 [Actinomycetota bacterium]|jgi:hypothetical protein
MLLASTLVIASGIAAMAPATASIFDTTNNTIVRIDPLEWDIRGDVVIRQISCADNTQSSGCFFPQWVEIARNRFYAKAGSTTDVISRDIASSEKYRFFIENAVAVNDGESYDVANAFADVYNSFGAPQSIEDSSNGARRDPKLGVPLKAALTKQSGNYELKFHPWQGWKNAEDARWHKAKPFYVEKAKELQALSNLGDASEVERPECTITGTEGDDVIKGTPGADVICGLGGNDIIYAGSGDDIIYAGDGDDIIYAGDGDDIVGGGSGNDVIKGGDGDDFLKGATGEDLLDGSQGSDRLDAGTGDDALLLAPGTGYFLEESFLPTGKPFAEGSTILGRQLPSGPRYTPKGVVILGEDSDGRPATWVEELPESNPLDPDYWNRQLV